MADASIERERDGMGLDPSGFGPHSVWNPHGVQIPVRSDATGFRSQCVRMPLGSDATVFGCHWVRMPLGSDPSAFGCH